MKSKEFSLFCALLDSEFLHSLEKDEIFIVVKHNYLFHFLSNERKFSTLINTTRSEFPECKLKIVYKGKLYEHNEINSQIKKTTEEIPKPESKVPAVVPPENNNVESSGSSMHEAAYSAIKYMRGEIVMHRVISDKAEEVEVS